MTMNLVRPAVLVLVAWFMQFEPLAAFGDAGPVKVFILAGQSNMVGHGIIESRPDRNDGKGSLEWLVHESPRKSAYKHLRDDTGRWIERDDVDIWFLGRQGGLRPGFGADENKIGPELGFGTVVGDAIDEPVVLVKIAWGGKAIGKEFRPPSSGGEVGPEYTMLVEESRKALASIGDLFPDLADREVELAGFGWHQGWNDRVNQEFNDAYETNLANFIRDIRKAMEAPDLPVVIAETGMTGPTESHPRALSLMAAQKAVAEKPEFKGTVAFVPTRDFWRDQSESPSGQGYHWNTNAETYYLIGDGMGRAMLALTQDGGKATPIVAPGARGRVAEPPTPIDEQQELARLAESRDERMAWWRDARLGMFIHWGLYAPAGGMWDGKVYPQHYAEWIQHWAAVPCAEYARQMKPLFQPDEGFAEDWADLAAKAGMRYAVMTSKHHDGFTLFNSSEPYSIENDIAGGTNISPEGRDVAREFADAMRAKGLRAGFYYSLLDWQHPDAFPMALPGYPKTDRPRDHAVYRDYVRGHVSELLRDYGPLSTIWFDYSDRERQGEAWGAARLMADMRQAQPDILVNNRLYFGLENSNGDYGTPEKYVPPTGLPGMDWEVNHTLNESYGYSSHDANWKSTDEVIRLLCDIVSKGGNLLLNIGPDANGRVPEPAREALLGLGAWMDIHEEAIRGTTASPFERLPWGRATRKGEDVLYLLVFDWPEDGRLRVPMAGQVRHARLLGADVALRTRSGENGLELMLPAAPVHPGCSVIRLDLDGEVRPTAFAVASGAGGVVTLSPFDATLAGPSIKVERVGVIGDVRHNIGYWLDTAATVSWPIAIEAGEGGRFRIEGEIGCKDAAAGAEVDILLDGEVVAAFTVPATGGAWQDYRIVNLGEIEIGSGRHDLVLKARTKPGEAVMNIRGIRLVPAGVK